MSDRDRDFQNRRSRDEDDQDDGPSFRRMERSRRDLEDDLDEDLDAHRRSRGASREADRDEDRDGDEGGVEPKRSVFARLILPVGGGILAGGALLAGLTLFLADETGTGSFVSPPGVSPPLQAGMAPGATTPRVGPSQAAPNEPPRGLSPGLAPGFAQGSQTQGPQTQGAQTQVPQTPSPGQVASGGPVISLPAVPSQAAPNEPSRGISPGLAPGFAQGLQTQRPQTQGSQTQGSQTQGSQISPQVQAGSGVPVAGLPMVSTPGGLSGQPQPMPGAAAESAVVPGRLPEAVAARLSQEDVRRLEERLARGEERAQELQARLAEAMERINRYRRGNEALLAGITDLRAEIDLQDAAIAELRRRLEGRQRENSAQAAEPAREAAAPRPSPAQIPIRLANFNSNTRLTLSFPAEPVYDVDQRDNEVRVRFLGGELPNLLGLPAQIRNIESIASAPGMLEIRVTEGVTVRHAQVGAQISLSFFNRGLEPPATAGAAPRERRPEPVQQAEAPRPSAAPSGAPAAPPAAAAAEPSRPAVAGATTPSPAVPPAAPQAQPVAVERPAGAAAQPIQQASTTSLAGFRLRSVSRRAVLIETSEGDIHRVELGEALPNSTVVAQEVRWDGDRWVLVTSAGILRP